jgi:hypothetical protein
VELGVAYGQGFALGRPAAELLPDGAGARAPSSPGA